MDLTHTESGPGNPEVEQPWLARRECASGDLRYSVARNSSAFVLLGFGGVLLLISFALAWNLPRLLHENGYPGLIPVLITACVGIALTTRGVRLTISWVKYGASRFHLESVPVPLGGPLRGELRMATPIPAGQPVRLKLQCCSYTTMEWTKSDGSTDQSTNQNIVWEDEETLPSDGSGIVQVSFVIPADAPATRFQQRLRKAKSQSSASIWWVEWRLKAGDPTGRTEGYQAEFELPVFRVAETAQQAAEAESIRAVRKVEIEAYQPGPDFRVRVTPTKEGGSEFFFPPVRGGANAVGQTIVFLMFSAPLVALAGQLPLWFVAVWGTIDLLFLGWILRLWFAPEEVVIEKENITVTSGLFAKKRRMATSEVTAIHATKGGYTLNHNIRIVGHGWHVMQVFDGIREAREAEWLARQMSIAAGVKPADPIPLNANLEQVRILQAFVSDYRAGTLLRPKDAEPRPENDEKPQ
jgi:hypothetical protein